MFIIGRMSAQVPMNMSICGCMLTFYKLVSHVLFHVITELVNLSTQIQLHKRASYSYCARS